MGLTSATSRGRLAFMTPRYLDTIPRDPITAQSVEARAHLATTRALTAPEPTAPAEHPTARPHARPQPSRSVRSMDHILAFSLASQLILIAGALFSTGLVQLVVALAMLAVTIVVLASVIRVITNPHRPLNHRRPTLRLPAR